MLCVANYEIKSTLSLIADGQWLKFHHPKGLFSARIRNNARSDFSTPFLLSLHLKFDVQTFDMAADIAEERLADCLNILALTTGSRFERHRIRQIVDCTPNVDMRSCMMWGDSIGHEDPTPFLEEQIMNSINRLLTNDMSPAMSRAMRWYRLGINALVRDDQFQYFWFALELIAISQKSTAKVPDQCPHCKSPLYCETCKKHPLHKPYDKQAIRAMIKAVDNDCDEATLERLGDTRNALMHGATLREFEKKFTEPHEEIVDVLGRIVFKVLISQISRETFTEKMVFGNPSTYIHRTLTGVAHLQTIVPIDAEGEFDLSFSGTKVTMVSNAPPQSARPTLIGMTQVQHKRLIQLSYENGDHQEMCRRISQHSEVQGEMVAAIVLATDMGRILEATKRGDPGGWQDFFREVLREDKPDNNPIAQN
ncbi:MAG TPA: methylamine utilization protein MauJ [Methylophilaceae bacterium]